MENTSAYLPLDRRLALVSQQPVTARGQGAVLFADISGFTALTDALVRQLGARRGMDEFTRHLNAVYAALIAEVDRFGGSVIGFSGDGITCWFGVTLPGIHLPAPEPTEPAPITATRRAVTAALAMQRAMQRFQALSISPTETVSLAIKTAIAAGTVQRCLVGNPAVQLIDVLAGATLDRVAATEQMARQGDVLVDEPTFALMHEQIEVQSWRSDAVGRRYALIANLQQPAAALEIPAEQLHLPAEQVKPWVLPAVYARLQNQQGRFLAELRPATALFLKFQGIDYDRDEQACSKLDRYIYWVQTVIERYEGALIQLTTGDKGSYLYAAFGAPIAHDDDTDRALAAAFDLRTPPADFAFITATQIGVSRGMMRVGAYGGPTRRTYGVLGEETNTAARLMSHARPGQIVVSQPVAEAVAAHYTLQELEPIRLKGRREPQLLYAVLARQRSGVSANKGQETALVGRDVELAQLMQWLPMVAQGEGHILRVEGVAGVGKSLLTANFIQQAASQGFLPAVAACQSTSQANAYSAARQIAQTLFGLGEPLPHPTPKGHPLSPAERGDLSSTLDALQVASQAEMETHLHPSAQAERGDLSGDQDSLQVTPLSLGEGPGVRSDITRLGATLTRLNPAWLVRMPLLGELLGLPIPDNPTTAAFDARLRQEALISLCVEIVQTSARADQPLLLVLEDIHWMDEASQRLLLALARVVNQAPLLLLLVQRPPAREDDAFLAEVAQLPHQTHLLLEELPRAGVAALVRNRLGAPVDALALAVIQTQTQGNPFFTEELVDALVDDNRLLLVDGYWSLAPPVIDKLNAAGCLKQVGSEWTLAPDAPLAAVDLGLPGTVQGIVLSRLDRLPEPVQLTIKVASVIGRIFAYDLLAAAHPFAAQEDTLPQHMALLQGRDFARLESPEPRLVYLFKHNITQEVAYQTLLEDQRQELHQAVAAVLEGTQPEPTADLAFHYSNSNLQRTPVRAKALYYLAAAGQRAQRDYANETALNYFDRALALEVRWPWLKAKVEILHILGRRHEEQATLELLSTTPEAPSFEVVLLWGEYYEAISEYDQARQAILQALDHARRLADPEREARSQARLGMIAWRQGNYEAAEQAYSAALGIIRDEDRFRDEEAEARYGLGLVYRQQGKYEEAQREFARDLVLNRALANRQNEARTVIALGHVELLRRNYQSAISFYQEAMEIYQAIGDRAGLGTSLLSLAQGMGYLGDHSQAEPMLLEALKIHQVTNDRWSTISVWNELGILYLMVGMWDKAKHSLQQGLQLSREIDDNSGEAYTLCNLGQVLREQEEFEVAETILGEGQLLAQAQGNANLEAIYFSDLAMVKLRSGKVSEAITLAEKSLEKFRSLDLLLSTTADLASLALAHWQLRYNTKAFYYAREAIKILDQCDGQGPDYPHRDYWACYQVLFGLGEVNQANQALQSAYRLLMIQANRISDPAMRQSYVDITYNRAIIRAAQQIGLDRGLA